MKKLFKILFGNFPEKIIVFDEFLYFINHRKLSYIKIILHSHLSYFKEHCIQDYEYKLEIIAEEENGKVVLFREVVASGTAFGKLNDLKTIVKNTEDKYNLQYFLYAQKYLDKIKNINPIQILVFDSKGKVFSKKEEIDEEIEKLEEAVSFQEKEIDFY